MNPFKLFSVSEHSAKLTKDIASTLQVAPGALYNTRFSDGEVYARFDETIRGETVVLIAQVDLPYHHLFELFVAADAARRSSAKEIVAVIPYLPHSRQERRDGERTAVTSRLIADFIEHAGATRVLTVDMHTLSIEGFFKLPIDHLQMSSVFLDDLRRRYAKDDLLLCSPDFGGLKRIRAYKQALDCDMAVIHKERLRPNQVDNMEIIGTVKDRDVVLIDDLIDTGGTLVKAAELLLRQGARSVSAYCTHAVLSGDAPKRLLASPLKEIVWTNTIPNRPTGGKFRTINCAPLLARALKQLLSNQSIKAINQL